MDYKYIEQLLERYWEAETTPQEEMILRTFFSQTELPEALRRYKPLFEYEQAAACEESLGEDFDQKVMAQIRALNPKQQGSDLRVKARKLTIGQRLRPLYRAAASVAIVLLLGTVAQTAFQNRGTNEAWDYNSEGYADTYQKPEEALDAGLDGLAEIKAMLNSDEENDSLSYKMVQP